MALAVALIALVFAGCGDDSADGDRASSGAASESSQPDPVTGATAATEPATEPDAAAAEEDPGQSGATSPGAGGSTSHESFRSPSGNISCAATDAGTRCEIADYAYEPPPRPKKCKFDWGGSVTVGGEFAGQVVCVSDSVANPSAPVLDYGQTNTVGNVACESSEAGIRCESSATGHGFFLSIQQVDVF